MSESEVHGIREEICDRSQALFSEQGVDHVGLRTIGTSLGMTAAALYRYFPGGRDEILAAVRARAFQQFADITEQTFQSDGNSFERFQELGRAHVEFAQNNTVAYHMMFDLAQSGDYPELRKQAKRAREVLFDAVAEVAKDEQLSVEAHMLSHVAWAAMHGAVLLETSGQLRFGVSIGQLMTKLSELIFQRVSDNELSGN